MDRNVQPADDAQHRRVDDPLGLCQRLLDVRVAAVGDHNKPSASHVDDERLLGDESQPEERA
jgi:hypothetical protein